MFPKSRISKKKKNKVFLALFVTLTCPVITQSVNHAVGLRFGHLTQNFQEITNQLLIF